MEEEGVRAVVFTGSLIHKPNFDGSPTLPFVIPTGA
jgi:hypothetical protein